MVSSRTKFASSYLATTFIVTATKAPKPTTSAPTPVEIKAALNVNEPAVSAAVAAVVATRAAEYMACPAAATLEDTAIAAKVAPITVNDTTKNLITFISIASAKDFKAFAATKTIGAIALPKTSAISPRALLACFSCPDVVDANCFANPPYLSSTLAVIAATFSCFVILESSSTPYLPRAFVDVPNDLATNNEAVLRSIPIPADKSKVALVNVFVCSVVAPKAPI